MNSQPLLFSGLQGFRLSHFCYQAAHCNEQTLSPLKNLIPFVSWETNETPNYLKYVLSAHTTYTPSVYIQSL